MPVNILMPALSPTMEKGNLAKWLKKEGDKVKPGDVIAEIETDKATMEYEAIDEGTLAKIVVPEGTQDVPVRAVIAVLAEEGEDVKAAAAGAATSAPAPKAAPPAKPASAPAPPPMEERVSARPSPSMRSAPAVSEAAPARAAPQASAASVSQPGEGEGTRVARANRVFSSPLARRLAKEAGIDLARVQGSGPHGRVIARDVEAAKSGRGLAAPAAASPVGAAALTVQTPADEKIRALFEPGSYDAVAHDNIRKVIARRLVEAKLTIPHFYLTLECNIGKLVAAREEINAAAPKDKDGKPAYKISVNDFVIGVAVSIPGGLITPVVRQAEQKSLSVISNEMKDFAARARARKLAPHEYQGGTSAVSNLGMYGIKEFYAIINPPHATILSVGAGEERAIVRNGKIEAAHMMTVGLATDHRAVDGALGAMLLGAFKTLIENPVMMVV